MTEPASQLRNQHLTTLQRYSRWVVAFSGGADSSALLHLLVQLRKQWPDDTSPPALAALHINHQLQTQADDWATHCEQFCAQLGVACEVVNVTVDAQGSGLERAAREARYAIFEQRVTADTCLLMAHHADDQAETLLLRLMRGSGLRGLAGIPVQRNIGEGLLLRPLLDCSRSDLQRYADQHCPGYIDDPSNADERHDRNFLRHQVMPLLAQRWPAAVEVITRASAHAAEAGQLLDALGSDDLDTLDPCRDFWGHSVDQLALAALEPARQRNVLRCWLTQLGEPSPSTAVLGQICQLLSAEQCDSNSGLAQVKSGAVSLRLHRKRLYLVDDRRWQQLHEQLARNLGWQVGERYALAGFGELRSTAVDGSPSGPVVALPAGLALVWGGRRGGAALVERGVTRSLKAFLNEAGVPAWARDSLPILYTADGQLVCVADLAVNEQFSPGAAAQGLSHWQLQWQREAL